MDRRSVLKITGTLSAAATALVALPRVGICCLTREAFKNPKVAGFVE